MGKIKNFFRPIFRNLRRMLFEFKLWKIREFQAPAPKIVKDKVLTRNAFCCGIWIETGTFLGETTALLAKSSKHVYSIEPEAELYSRAHRKFYSHQNVTILNGTSETLFPELLKNVTGPVNFWLDGHYSGGNTFRGNDDTPIKAELAEIERRADSLGLICVMIDDLRCFDPRNPEYASYPSIDYLVDWARRNGLNWHVEHDIFIAKSQL